MLQIRDRGLEMSCKITEITGDENGIPVVYGGVVMIQIFTCRVL